MYYPDLAPCDYFGEGSEQLLAIGWLEPGHRFARGPVDEVGLSWLEVMLRDPWPGARFMGTHVCELCTSGWPLWRRFFRRPQTPPEGHRDLFIPATGAVYAVPELVVHYIREHGYQPPPQLWAAVRDCPPVGDPEYFEAIRRCLPGNALPFAI